MSGNNGMLAVGACGAWDRLVSFPDECDCADDTELCHNQEHFREYGDAYALSIQSQLVIDNATYNVADYEVTNSEMGRFIADVGNRLAGNAFVSDSEMSAYQQAIVEFMIHSSNPEFTLNYYMSLSGFVPSPA